MRFAHKQFFVIFFFLCYSLTAISSLTRAEYFKSFDPKSSYSCKLYLVTPEVSVKYHIRKIKQHYLYNWLKHKRTQHLIVRSPLFQGELHLGRENKAVQKHKSTIQQYFMDKHFIFSFTARSLEGNFSQGKEYSKVSETSDLFCDNLISTGLYLYPIYNIIQETTPVLQRTFDVPSRYSTPTLTSVNLLFLQQ